jgi:hypothetical protein
MITMFSDHEENIQFNVYPVNSIISVRRDDYDSARNRHMVSKRSINGEHNFINDYFVPENYYSKQIDSKISSAK